MKVVKEASHLLEKPDSCTGTNVMFVLNALYKKLFELSSPSTAGAETAEFAKAVVAEIKKKFKKENSFWVFLLGYFDPKNKIDGCVPSWFTNSERNQTIRKIENLIEEWSESSADHPPA